ncbi:uncharacterized protein [Palaemon carinicauda]|uniref:uncharacterized protein n=1 Tax=Palaemon carinicauda TaxID=392227 RepID=UPI0035B69A30
MGASVQQSSLPSEVDPLTLVEVVVSEVSYAASSISSATPNSTAVAADLVSPVPDHPPRGKLSSPPLCPGGLPSPAVKRRLFGSTSSLQSPAEEPPSDLHSSSITAPATSLVTLVLDLSADHSQSPSVDGRPFKRHVDPPSSRPADLPSPFPTPVQPTVAPPNCATARHHSPCAPRANAPFCAHQKLVTLQRFGAPLILLAPTDSRILTRSPASHAPTGPRSHAYPAHPVRTRPGSPTRQHTTAHLRSPSRPQSPTSQRSPAPKSLAPTRLRSPMRLPPLARQRFPTRQHSPVHQRSPVCQYSPTRQHSPARQRSPTRQRSLALQHVRSSSAARQRSPTRRPARWSAHHYSSVQKSVGEMKTTLPPPPFTSAPAPA